ncbi:hypothetical protein Cni_G22874 [Canna indica]|uniref:Uncharacterized protein n=1 Tax=Canna indica TaxID=4628 RepID=A0AAQ3KSK7_9LILI|nr:hypothetical protein Cni_G22874 [Canna indica]
MTVRVASDTIQEAAAERNWPSLPSFARLRCGSLFLSSKTRSHYRINNIPDQPKMPLLCSLNDGFYSYVCKSPPSSPTSTSSSSPTKSSRRKTWPTSTMAFSRAWASPSPSTSLRSSTPHGQARRHHPKVQELPRQVHLRAGPRERDCSDDLGSAEERAVERRGDNEAEDEAGVAEAREADDYGWGVRVAQLPPPPRSHSASPMIGGGHDKANGSGEDDHEVDDEY